MELPSIASFAPKPGAGKVRLALLVVGETVTAPGVVIDWLAAGGPTMAAAVRFSGAAALDAMLSIPVPWARMSPSACSATALKPLTVLLFGPSVIWPDVELLFAAAMSRSAPVPSGELAKVAAAELEFVNVIS